MKEGYEGIFVALGMFAVASCVLFVTKVVLGW